MPLKLFLKTRCIPFCALLLAFLGVQGSAQNWPMFHADQQNTGVSPMSGPLKQPAAYATDGLVMSSPALYDVDTDNACEIFFGTRIGTKPNQGGRLYALTYDPPGIFKIVSTWPPNPLKFPNGYLVSSPVVCKVNPGVIGLFIGCGDNKVYGFNAATGSPLSGWPYTTSNEVWSSPKLANIDQDLTGKMEVVVGSHDGKLHLIDAATGSSLPSPWPYPTGSALGMSAAVGDVVPYSAGLEIVFGNLGGKVYCLDANGYLLWTRTLDPTNPKPVRSAPALADLNLNGPGTFEVVVGCDDGKVYFLNGSDGSFLTSFNTGQIVYTTPAIADLNQDTYLDVVVGSYDNTVYAIDGNGYSSTLWTFPTGNDVISSPAIADFDGNGYPDVAIGSYDGNVYVLMGGRLFSSSQYKILYTLTYYLGAAIYSSPAVGDIDGDNLPEIVVGTQNAASGIVAIDF